MAGSLIGALRVTLGIDTAAFEEGLSAAQRKLTDTGKNLSAIGDRISDVGKTLSVAVTAPIVAAGVGIVKMAGDFEASMNKVSISTQASAGQMKAMSALALKLGSDTTFSASQAADAMDMLAKNGLTATDILGGAAKAALNLAAAAGSELDPAAAAITDTLQQFKLKVSDLPMIVNQITGAVNQSKLDFADYQQAAAAAGGVAANVGVNFKDFSAVLAGISPLFASGSDAGTSFKTMLMAIGNPSKQAAAEIKRLGLEFYDAQGKLRPMSDIAEQLRQKLGGLSDEAKTHSLATIFGSDAIRSALGLMQLGGKGLDDIKAKIASTDAAAQSAQRLKGFNGQLEQLKGAFETLAITIGNSGLLSFVTDLVAGFAAFLNKLSDLSPTALNIGVAIAAVAAAIGPLLIALGSLVSAAGAVMGVLGSTALAGVLAAIGPFILPVVAAVAALAAGWALFGDKVGPVLSSLWERLTAALGPRLMALFETVKATLTDLWTGPFGDAIRVVIAVLGDFMAAYTNVFGEVLIRILSALVEAVTSTFKIIGDIFKVIAALLRGDFSAAWAGVKTLVGDVVTGWLNVLEALAPGAIAAMKALYDGVKTWIGDKLGALWEWAKGKIKDVGDAFYQLWDRVVGHSYIPDLFDGIAHHAARLEPEFVNPVLAGIAKVDDAFGSLSFPDLSFPTPTIPTPTNDNGDTPSTPTGLSAKGTDNLRDAIKQTFSDGVKAALKGDLKGFFQNFFESIFTKSVDGLLDKLFSAIGSIGGKSDGGGIGGVISGVLGAIFGGGGARANGGPVLANQPYIVGEKRPELFVPSTAGRIDPNVTRVDRHRSNGALPGVTINFNGPVSNPQEVRRSAAQAGAAVARVVAAGQRGM